MASDDPIPEATAPVARPRRTVVVLGAAVVSGVAGYVVLVLTARFLDAAENADFLVFWGALFGVFGVLIGISSETTRAVFASPEGAAVGVRVVPISAALGVGSVAVR
jgi:O-antigen/teichoic acid export membrane protein